MLAQLTSMDKMGPSLLLFSIVLVWRFVIKAVKPDATANCPQITCLESCTSTNLFLKLLFAWDKVQSSHHDSSWHVVFRIVWEIHPGVLLRSVLFSPCQDQRRKCGQSCRGGCQGSETKLRFKWEIKFLMRRISTVIPCQFCLSWPFLGSSRPFLSDFLRPVTQIL